MSGDKQLLIKINCIDAPGITATITSLIDRYYAKFVDINQAVTHNQLNLYVLVEVSETVGEEISKALPDALKKFDAEVSCSYVTGKVKPHSTTDRFVTTVIADEIEPKFIAEITQTIASHNANIDSIRKLNQNKVSTLEISAFSEKKQSIAQIQEKLLLIADRYKSVDLAVQRENLYRRSKRLVVFDMDSTLIQAEVVDELAKHTRHADEVIDITRRAMEGEIDFQEALIRRTGYLKGLTHEDLEAVSRRIEFTPGAHKLIRILKRLGYKTAVISGGYTYFTEWAKNELGLDFSYGNQLDIENGVLTGQLQGLIVDAARKADLLDMLAQLNNIPLDQVIAVGDGANDLHMLKKAGLGIAFNAKPITKQTVGTSISEKSLDTILYFLGFTEADVKSADLF